MFTASPGAILVVGLGLGLVVRWLDTLTEPPKPDEETAWCRVPVAAAAVREMLALPAPSPVLMQEIKVSQKEPVELVRAAPAPVKAARAPVASSRRPPTRKG